MASMVDRLNKLREERMAREKARIEKLRDLNLKKYSSSDALLPKSSSTVSITSKTKLDVPSVNPTTSSSDTNAITKNANAAKSNLKRSITAPKVLPNKDARKSFATNNIKAPNKFNEKSKLGTTVKTVIKECGDVKNDENLSKKDVSGSKIPTNNIKSNSAIEKKISVINNVIIEDKNTIIENKEIHVVKNQEDKVGTIEESIPKIVITDQAKDANCDIDSSKSKTIDRNNKLINETNNQVKKSNLKSTIPTPRQNGTKNVNGNKVNNFNSRKSIAFMSKVDAKPKPVDRRKTMIPEPREKSHTTTNPKESVFERLYKPKTVHKQPIDNVTKLKTDPNFLKKVIKDSQMITHRRHTVFDQQTEVRRSISAIHFKRVHKSELNNCIHKWKSIGDDINKEDVQDVNEDESLKDEKVISAVKSERKRVKFQTPLPSNFNTPKPEELQSRLQNWLKKRGKSLDSYHHLQCFGLHHLSDNNIKPFKAPKFDDADENKENIALEHDSDNESFLENNNQNGNLEDEEKAPFPADNWRRASNLTDTSDFNESYVSTLASGEVMHHVDELLLGALNDLTELLREGFDWEQCARWLRALRERFPSAPDSAPYWECRAALEERRGDLHATVQCLEQAIAKGTELSPNNTTSDTKVHDPNIHQHYISCLTQSVVEANLDSLLDKFMQLKISPSCGQRRVDPKLVDVKNVFKSTIIRFAVQQAKLQSSGTPKYTVTPVRRSHRLSRTDTPLRVCSSLHHVKQLGAEFRPNKALSDSP